MRCATVAAHPRPRQQHDRHRDGASQPGKAARTYGVVVTVGMQPPKRAHDQARKQ